MAKNEKPRESARLYRELFYQIETGLAILRLENRDDPRSLRLIAANPAARRAAGVAVEDYEGKLLADAAPKVFETGIPQACAEVVRSGQARDMGQIQPGDKGVSGAVFAVKVHPLPDDCAAVVFEGISERKQGEEGLAITERKRTQGALEQAAKRLELATLATHDALYDWDFVSHEIWRNENYQQLFGAPERSLDSDNWWAHHLHPEDRERLVAAQKAALGGEDNLFPSEFRLRRPNGSYADIAARSLIVRNAKGQVVRVIGALTDISERKRAEEALREREALLNKVGQIAKIGGWEWDLITRKARWTRGTYDIVEIEPGDPIPGPDEDLGYFLPEDRASLGESIQALIEENKPLDAEARLRTAKGNVKWCRAIAEAVREGDKCVKVRGTFQDITEHKRAEEALAASEQRYWELFENATDIVFSSDLQGNFTSVNKAGEQNSGYTRAELTSMNVLQILAPEYLEEGRRVLEGLAAGREPGIGEWEIVAKDGHRVRLEVGLRLVRRNGEFDEVQGIARDISERKRAEEALRQSEQFNREVIASAREGVIVYDRQFRYRVWNRFMEELTGVPASQLLGKQGFGIFPHLREQKVDALFQRALDGEEVHSPDTPFRVPVTGKSGWVSSIFNPHFGPNGEIIGVISIVRDITERRRAQEALEQAATRFERVTLATQDALYDWDLLSHEIWRNENYQRLFGAPERSLDSDNWWLGRLHPEDRERVLTARNAALGSEGNLFSLEFRLRRPDGSYADIVERSLIVRDAKGQVARMIGALTDISERKRADEQLLESEDRYRDLVEHSSDLMCTHDLKGRLLSVNQASATFLGYTPDEMSGMSLRELLVPEVRDQFDAYLETVGREGSARGLMVVQKRAGERRIWEYSSTLRTKGVPAPIVRGVAHDVTERVHAQKELRESQRRLELIARASNTGLWDWDLRANLVYYSPEWKSLIGYAEHEVSNRFEEWETRIHPEDLPGAIGRVRDYLANPQGEFENEFRLRHKDGSYRWILARGSVLKDDHGEPCRMLGSHLDITERKRVEEEVFHSRQMLQSVLDHIPQGVFWKDRNGVYLGGNNTFAVDAGLATRDRVPGKTDFALAWGPLPQASAYRVDDQLVMENDSPKLDYEEVMPQPGGHVSWVRTSKIPLHDREGKVIGILGTYEDITERKRAEEQIQNLSRFPQENPNPVLRLRGDGTLIYANPGARPLLQLWGCEPGQRVPDDWAKLVADSMASGAGKEVEVACDQRVYSFILGPIQTAGYLNAYGRDITERKRAEEASRESEERYRTLFENSPVGIYRTTADGRILAGNPAFAQMLGYSSSEELASRNLNAPDFEPQYSRDQFTEKLEKEGRITGLESEWRRRDGSVILVRENARAIQDEDGQILYYEGTVEDITERKRAEEGLRESEQFNREVIANVQEGVVVYDREFRYQLWNRFMEELTGVPASEALGKVAFDLFPHLREQKADLLIRRALAGEVVRAPDMPFRVPATGNSGWVSAVYGPHFGASGQIHGVIGTIRDITERKRAGEALRESEARFRATFKNAAVGIGLVDMQGHPVESNPALQKMLGYSALELAQMAFTQFTHPDDARADWDLFTELVEGKRDKYQLDKRFYRKDGEVVWGGLTVSLVRNQDGEPQYAIGMVEDITERKHAEAALRQMSGRLLRLQDEERRRIARELHDTTGQSLAALAINLSVVKDSAPDLSPRASACLGESLELAERSSREIRTLSYLLHPPLLDEAGLGSAMRWFVDGYAQRTGIHVDLEMPTKLTRLPGDIELALYRIVQEGLTNIHLHSGSKKAQICLKCRPGQAVLTVADEGRGLPPGLLERGGRLAAKRGVGISGMRERIRQLGGQFEIVTGSNGTTLTASVPLREEQA